MPQEGPGLGAVLDTKRGGQALIIIGNGNFAIRAGNRESVLIDNMIDGHIGIAAVTFTVVCLGHRQAAVGLELERNVAAFIIAWRIVNIMDGGQVFPYRHREVFAVDPSVLIFNPVECIRSHEFAGIVVLVGEHSAALDLGAVTLLGLDAAALGIVSVHPSDLHGVIGSVVIFFLHKMACLIVEVFVVCSVSNLAPALYRAAEACFLPVGAFDIRLAEPRLVRQGAGIEALGDFQSLLLLAGFDHDVRLALVCGGVVGHYDAHFSQACAGCGLDLAPVG